MDVGSSETGADPPRESATSNAMLTDSTFDAILDATHTPANDLVLPTTVTAFCESIEFISSSECVEDESVTQNQAADEVTQLTYPEMACVEEHIIEADKNNSDDIEATNIRISQVGECVSAPEVQGKEGGDSEVVTYGGSQVVKIITAPEEHQPFNSQLKEMAAADESEKTEQLELPETTAAALEASLKSSSTTNLNPLAASFIPTIEESVAEQLFGKEKAEESVLIRTASGWEEVSSVSLVEASVPNDEVKDDIIISQTVEILEPVLAEPINSDSPALDIEDLVDEEKETELIHGEIKGTDETSDDIEGNEDDNESLEMLSLPGGIKSHAGSITVTPGSESPVMVSPPLSDAGSRTPKLSQGSEAENSSGFEVISSGERSPVEEKTSTLFHWTVSDVQETPTPENSLPPIVTSIQEKDSVAVTPTTAVSATFVEGAAKDTVIEPVDAESILESTPPSETVEATPSAETVENKKEPEWEDILGSGQLMKKTVIEAEEDGDKPTVGQYVRIMTEGKLEDGSQLDFNESLLFTVGDHDVIQVWDIVTRMLQVGEVCEVKTDAKFAYGKLGREPDIPADAKIHYVIALLEIRPPLDYEKMPPKDRLNHGFLKKERGNFLFKRDEFSQAIVSYSKAVKILDADVGAAGDASGTPAELQELLDEKLKVYNNLAASQTKLLAYDAALKSCDTVLKLQPNNVKAVFRKGKVLEAKKENSEALVYYKRSLKLDPNSKVIKKDVERLSKLAKAQEDKEKRLYAKMLGTETSKAAGEPAKEGLTSPWANWFGSWAIAVAGTAALVGVTVAAIKIMT